MKSEKKLFRPLFNHGGVQKEFFGIARLASSCNRPVRKIGHAKAGLLHN